VFRILKRLQFDEQAALAAALLCMLMPTATMDVFYINHAYFILPLTILLGMIHIFLFPLKDRRLDIGVMTICAVIGQLSGEQTVPLYYLFFLAAVIVSWQKPEGRRQRLIRIVVPAVVSLLVVSFFFLTITWPSLQEIASSHERRRSEWYVLWMYIETHAKALSYKSVFYGSFSQPPSVRTIVGSILLLVISGSAFFFKQNLKEKIKPIPKPWIWVGVVILVDLVCLIPILLAVNKGYRFGIEHKYLYVSGFCLAIGGVVLVDLLTRRSSLVRAIIFTLAVAYTGSLTHYIAQDIWGTQKVIDNKIWSMVHKHRRPGIKYILFDGMMVEGFLQSNWSIAYSDFQIGKYTLDAQFKELWGRNPELVRRYHGSRSSGKIIRLEDYDGKIFYDADPASVLSIVVRHGPAFGAIEGGFYAAFPDFKEYLRFLAWEKNRKKSDL